eukprot:TRINITY_DN2385_c0_g2_i2.p1 TRINITY_DN2385_c0_g2~~TRINITY_DN2385_c0_g2_i2.p1  ORF type:complete len:321 (-),score=14.98 TRINITY_DN2385_c0_g2_i2:390-1301(-)
MGNVIVTLGLQITRWTDPKEDQWQALWRAGLSEFFATLIFVFIGCGSVIAAKSALGDQAINVASLTLIAMAHGFTIMVMIYTVGEVSGGHMNPAVTWGLLITDRISIKRCLVYVGAQIFGAVIGSAILYGLLPEGMRFALGCHAVNPNLTGLQGVGCEIIFTFIFILVVFSTAISPFVGKHAPLSGDNYGPGKLTPFAIGMTIMVLHCIGIPLTGASMNPARSFGPALVRGCWANHWVYWIGPLVGSTLAASVTQVLFLSTTAQLAKMLVATRGITERIDGASNEASDEESAADDAELDHRSS